MISDPAQFVAWFRHASPYIHAHRQHTFVISFDGEAVTSPGFKHLIHDTALLNNLGIRTVLVHGTRYQIEAALARKHLSWRYVDGLRITDDDALEAAKAACGEISANIMGLLSMGLANVPQLDPLLRHEAAAIRTVSGNFITARPVGVRNGVDFMHTGEVRRVDKNAIARQLDEGNIVLISPLGYSPSGEIFNLAVEDVANTVAVALGAGKWICLMEQDGLCDSEGNLIHHMVLPEAQRIFAQAQDEYLRNLLFHAIRACEYGVRRVHLIERCTDGGLLLELFSREGIGTLISKDPFENMRRAAIDDVHGIIELIEPLEQAGILVRRSREKLEMEIERFVVQERDGVLVACAALYPFAEEGMAELACVAVHSNYRREQRGDALLSYMEREARQAGLNRLFVLTTHTAHWFLERGFVPGNVDSLPVAKRQLYNLQRQSKVFVKML